MDKAFDPAAVEAHWRSRWEELRIGVADPRSDRPAFSIVLPPPNITAVLHMGHACGGTVQDILVRHHRMRGFEVEWCPGTDHAAIATNAVIERQLAAEGTSREELGRDAFLARVDRWYEETGGQILEQMRRLGFTCDWSRLRFTLDAGYVRSVRTAFKLLFDAGLIYRGPRIVTWCPHDRSAISDEEIEWQEHADTLTQLRYPLEGGGEVVVATVRPETMLGDTAVAVAPGDERHRHLVGRIAVLPLTHRRVPVIADPAVRPEFGTGCLKVTPGHDPTDYEIGQRHQLPTITVIAPNGTIDYPDLPRFHGLPVDQARVAVTEALREAGAVVAEQPYLHEVGHCDRCHHVLEHLVSAQWWVRMAELSRPAVDAVEAGEVRFHPRRYSDVYLSWMRGIRDWCISRQIWLGHHVPVSTCANGHAFAWIDPPERCARCDSTVLVPDPDVLDTWFSSALWPFAVFGWPDSTRELERFYPTSVLVTDRGIIFLWVARMIMTGLRFTGQRPFRDVLITSTIQAADGSRMQKSRGNAVDPLVMIESHGADAVRAWAAAVGTGGQDARFDEERIESYQRFANKLWNATRFLIGRLGDGGSLRELEPPDQLLPEDTWILGRLNAAIAAVDRALQAYRFHDALEHLYEITWHGFCDWYLEMVKPRLQEDAPAASRAAAAWTATVVLDGLLRLLHPFMPFVTEECAQRLPGAAPSLQLRAWPVLDLRWAGGSDGAGVEEVITLVQRVRALRDQAGVPRSRRDRVVIEGGAGDLETADRARLLAALAPVEVSTPGGGDGRLTAGIRLVAGSLAARYELRLEPQQRERLRRRLEEVARGVGSVQQQLDNPAFLAGAPADVVQGARSRLEDLVREQAAIRETLGD